MRSMPEGDTLHKIAAYMRLHMAGSRLTQAQAGCVALKMLCGRLIGDVYAIGKHLMIDFGRHANVSQRPSQTPHNPTWHLRVHLGLHGSWHVYGVDELWQRPAWQASVVLTTQEARQFVCFKAHDVEILRADEVLRTSVIRRLGPDLLGEHCDITAVVRRARLRAASAPLLDTLLDQSIAAGLGNVYKSELLFLFGLHPQTPTDCLSDAVLAEIFTRGRTLLQQNLGEWPRTTTYDRSQQPTGRRQAVPRLFVYRRRGQACLRCQARIVRSLWGRRPRSTYWCPQCQAPK